jgi:hypothetical protein
LEYGISTAVLKGANAPNDPGRANGEQVEGQEDELVMEGDPGCTSDAIPYTRVQPQAQAVVHHEPAPGNASAGGRGQGSLSANGNRNG